MKAKCFLQFSVITVLVMMTLSTGSVNAQSSQVLYAKAGGLTSGSCDSWANACELQYALTNATSGQEIWVAVGVYKPGTDRTATFQLKSGVGLYGGFAGTETARNQRNWNTNKTVLSGDIDNNDINDDGNFIAETAAQIQGENSYHIVRGSNTDNTTILEGFIITAGQANDSSPNDLGGGMYSYSGNPTLTNIIFSGNSANSGGGGGMYNELSDPFLTNITFASNFALCYYACLGGGMRNYNSNPTLTNVTFFDNRADTGGGMYNYNSNPRLRNVAFLQNTASMAAGGILNAYGSPILTNVTFYFNYGFEAGGMKNVYSNPIMTNITFHANYANSLDGWGGGIENIYSNPTIVNGILWGNSAPFGMPEIYNADLESTPTVTYSDVRGGWLGTGNIDADPLFVDAANGDLHLQAGSPAIDSGTNTGCPATDLDGNVRPQDGNNDGTATCDMGAFELPRPLPSFPTTSILDNFNRANGGLGLNWKGSNNSYRIFGNQVDVRGDGPIYWKDAFGMNQEVYVTLSTVDPAGLEQDLLLKVQGKYAPNWGDGVIEVWYSVARRDVTISTFRLDTLKWFKYPSISVTFANGDQFGAQALSTGDVVIFKNGMEAGRVTLNSADQNFFNSKGGKIGLWFIRAKNAFFDDFGGGNVVLP